jgi:HSP20 family protein
MLYRSFFPNDFFSELVRMQRDLNGNLGQSPSIRGLSRGYPALNVGTTHTSVEIYAFAPGIDPNNLDVQIEKNVLTISGERKLSATPTASTMHIDERYSGRFRRVVTLPDDIDPGAIKANYRDGVLHINVTRKEAAQARRITIQ